MVWDKNAIETLTKMVKTDVPYYFMPFRINAANNAENTNCPV